MRRILIILFSLIAFDLFCQIDIDSLTNVFEKLPNDTQSIGTIIRYGNSQKKIDLNVALAAQKTALQKAKSINDKAFIAKVSLYIGSIYTLLADYPNASTFLTDALKLSEETANKPIQLRAILSIGNLYSYNDQPEKALEMYKKALALCDETGDELNKATIYNNIGGLIYTASEFRKPELQEALSYFLKSTKIVEKLNNPGELTSKYSNLALLYCDLGKTDSALYYLEKTKTAMGANPVPDDLITYFSYMGRVYTDIKEFDKAEHYYFQSIEEAKKLNNPEWIYQGYISLSDMYIAQKKYDKALTYFQKFHFLKDSVLNAENFAQAADIQNKFEREKKEAELSKLKTEQTKNRIFNIALILISILLVISGIMMYSRFKIKAVSEKKLKLQNEIISQKNKDITDSIHYSRKIQDAILPSDQNIKEIFHDYFIFYKPKDIISGDFYWSAKSGKYKFFAVADCTGHGVPGALMSMLGTSLLKEIILTKNILNTNEILDELRRLVIHALDQNTSNQKDGMDISLIRFNEETKELQFSGANNSAQLYSGNTLTELKADKQPIGKYEKMENFKSHTLEIKSDTTVYLYTDGYADQFGGPKGKKFKYKQLDTLLTEHSSMSTEEQKQNLLQAFEKWKGSLEQIDDVCVAGIKIKV